MTNTPSQWGAGSTPPQAPPQQYVAAPVTAPPAEPVAAQVVQHDRAGSPALRIFQVLTGAVGAVLFVGGLVAVFRVDFGAGFFETSGAVAGFGFSPALALAAIVLGGAIMAAALAAGDRGAAAIVGLLTLIVGIVALVAEAEIPEEVGVDRRSALLFVVLGAAAFVLSLVPWWSGRRRTTRVDTLR